MVQETKGRKEVENLGLEEVLRAVEHPNGRTVNAVKIALAYDIVKGGEIQLQDYLKGEIPEEDELDIASRLTAKGATPEELTIFQEHPELTEEVLRRAGYKIKDFQDLALEKKTDLSRVFYSVKEYVLKFFEGISQLFESRGVCEEVAEVFGADPGQMSLDDCLKLYSIFPDKQWIKCTDDMAGLIKSVGIAYRDSSGDLGIKYFWTTTKLARFLKSLKEKGGHLAEHGGDIWGDLIGSNHYFSGAIARRGDLVLDDYGKLSAPKVGTKAFEYAQAIHELEQAGFSVAIYSPILKRAYDLIKKQV